MKTLLKRFRSFTVTEKIGVCIGACFALPPVLLLSPILLIVWGIVCIDKLMGVDVDNPYY